MIRNFQIIQENNEEINDRIKRTKKTEDFKSAWKRVVRKSRKASMNGLDEANIYIEKENPALLHEALCDEMKISSKMVYPFFETNVDENGISIRFHK